MTTANDTDRAYKNGFKDGLMKALEIVRTVKPEDIREYLEEQLKEAHESPEGRKA